MSSTPHQPTFAVDGHVFPAKPLAGGLHLVATPLGNLGDISLRALSALASADVVLCEDTRVTSRLMQRYSIGTRLRPYHDHNAAQVRPAILGKLRDGGRIVLVSDAGMPAISDPGYKLVRECVDAGIPVDVIPGPTAPVTALALSGLPTDRFLFAGFLSARPGQRQSQLAGLGTVPATLVLFESANRLSALLQDIARLMPDRQVAVTRELTKLHQEVLRGSAAGLFERLDTAPPLKGEITIVIGPPDGQTKVSGEQLEQRLRELLHEHPASKAASILARQTDEPRAVIYELAMKLKEGRQ